MEGFQPVHTISAVDTLSYPCSSSLTYQVGRATEGGLLTLREMAEEDAAAAAEAAAAEAEANPQQQGGGGEGGADAEGGEGGATAGDTSINDGVIKEEVRIELPAAGVEGWDHETHVAYIEQVYRWTT